MGRPGQVAGVGLRAAAAVLLACAVLAPLAVHWAEGRTVVWFDTLRLYAPQRALIDEALRSFRLPLWDPFMGAGLPLLADAIHGVLHPVSLLAASLRTDRSVDVLVGGHVACAGLGAALLARDLGASRPGAALAAFAYAMSGFVLSMAGNLVFLAGAGSLPFCLAGLRRAAADPRPAHLALGAAGAAALALSGDAQALVVGGGLSLALAWEAAGWRGAVRAVAAGLLGLAVAGIQLVPTAVHVPRTVRDADTWLRDPAVWKLEAWRLPELVVPGLLSGPRPYEDAVYAALAGPGAWPPFATPMPFAASLFVGLVPAALALAGARAARRGAVLAALAIVLAWIGLGPVLGADQLLGSLPLWRAFRYAEKLAGPLTLVLALLAGLGLDAVVERRVAGWQVGAGALLLAAAALAACRVDLARLAPAVAHVAETRVLRGAVHLAGAAVALGAWLALRDRLGAAAARVALAAVAWGGMAAAAPLALHPGDADARLRAPGPALAAPSPGPRLATPYLHDLQFPGAGGDDLDRAAREHALLGYPAFNVRARLDSLNEYSAMPPKRLALLAGEGWSHWPLAPRRYAATHVIVDPPATPEEAALYARVTRGATREDAVPGRYEVWAVPHRPWASFAPAVRTEPDGERALALTVQALADGSPEVVVESFGAFAAGPGRVLAVGRGLDALRVEAEAPGDATLVVADAWWPGWQATLDGVAAPIFRADGLVRAVRWPAGRHVLEMRYRPPEVDQGLAVTALGLVALAGWMTLQRRRGRGSGPGLEGP